jgi:hypothetical protein
MWVGRGHIVVGIGEGVASFTVPRKPSGVIDEADTLVSDLDEMQDMVG